MRVKSILRWVALLGCGLAVGSAVAHGGSYRPQTSVQFGINYGPAWGHSHSYGYWPRIYTPPVIVASPPQTVYIERPAPTVYIEQPPPVSVAVPALEPGYWYYCRESAAYYPYVKQCAGDWHKVPPAR